MSVVPKDIKVAFDEYLVFEKKRVKCKHCNWDVSRNLTRQKTHLERDCKEYRQWRIGEGAPLALYSDILAENRKDSTATQAKDSKRRKIGRVHGSIAELESGNHLSESSARSTDPIIRPSKSGSHLPRITQRGTNDPLVSNTSQNNSPLLSSEASILVSSDATSLILDEQSICKMNPESFEILERSLELAERELDLRQRKLQVRREELELMRLEKELLSTPK